VKKIQTKQNKQKQGKQNKQEKHEVLKSSKSFLLNICELKVKLHSLYM